MPQWIRSVLGVLGGLLVIVIVVAVCTKVQTLTMGANHDHPTALFLTINLLFSFAAALVGGYVAALIAGHSPVAHGVALAVLMLVLAVINLEKGVGGEATVYVVLLNIGGPLCAVLGAWVRARRGRRVVGDL